MSIDNEVVHIGFVCPENMPEPILKDMMEGLDTEKLNFDIRRVPNPVYNAFEWAVPGIIAAYILKPYFESFLKEAGKDHYILLSKWLKDLVTKARRIKVHTIAATQSKDKIDPTYRQSKSISIYCHTKNDKLIKLLFDETLSDADWENAVEKILQLLMENYADSPNDTLSDKLKGLNQKYRTFYAFIDEDTKEWVFMDDKELMHIRIQSSRMQKK
jgi:hypothetical protein